MLQKISDFIKFELQSMLKNRQQSQKFSLNVNCNNFLATSRKTFSGAMLHEYQCATGSKILTEPEPDWIGIILAGTGPDYKQEKFNRIRLDWPDRPDWPDFNRIFKTLIINLQVTNINLHGSFNFEI